MITTIATDTDTLQTTEVTTTVKKLTRADLMAQQTALMERKSNFDASIQLQIDAITAQIAILDAYVAPIQ